MFCFQNKYRVGAEPKVRIKKTCHKTCYLNCCCFSLKSINLQSNCSAMEIEFDINSVDKLPEHKYECKY